MVYFPNCYGGILLDYYIHLALELQFHEGLCPALILKTLEKMQ